jgi:tetratricopeptide (TPR) repeat protein
VAARALLDDEAPALRARAAAFLSLFRTRAAEAELVPALERRLARESEPAVRATLAFALGHVLPVRSDGANAKDAALRELVDAREHGAVRVMAAILLARRGVRDDAVSQTLVGALSAADDVEAVFTSTPVTTDGIAGEAARAIGLLGTAARVLPALTERLRAVSSFEAVNLLEAALGAAFPHDAKLPAEARALTEPQRALLQALVDNDEGFWGLGNALGILMDREMPSDREAMAAYLGVTFTHDHAREEVRHAEMMLHSFHDAERALEHIERALAENPRLGRAHLIKGFALLELDDVAGACAAFQSAVPLVEDEDRMLARKNTAVLLGDLGRRAEALTFLEQNVAEQPGSSVAWYDLGLSLVKAGEHGRCIEAILRCLAIQPDVANAHYTIACAYALRSTTPRAQAGDVERALSSIKAAVELDEDLMDGIRDDDDFASIRNDARFVALVGGRA